MAARATRRPRPWLALGQLVTYPVILALGFGWYAWQTDVDTSRLVRLELAGSSERAREAGRSFESGRSADEPPWEQSVAEALVWPDIGLIVGYVLALAGLCWLGRRVFRAASMRRLASVGVGAAVVAGVFDGAENFLLHRGLTARSFDSVPWSLIAAAATVKFVLLGVAALVSAAVAVVVTARLVSPRPDFAWTDNLVHLPPDASNATTPRRWWQFCRPPSPPGTPPPKAVLPPSNDAPPGRTRTADFGISLSGGGIRSGTTTLGVLQVLRQSDWWKRTEYLVSVSGGGYVTGALRLAAQPLSGVEVRSTVQDAFEQQSPELDHLRRHGRYIADTPMQWLVALSVVLRGVLASLGLLAGALTLLGLTFGALYRAVPLARMADVAREDPDLSEAIRPGGLIAIGVALTLVLGLWLFQLVLRVVFNQRSRLPTRGVIAVCWLGGPLALVCVVLPLLVWSYYEVAAFNGVPGAAGTGLVTVLTTYVGALTAILWRQRDKAKDWLDKLKPWTESAPEAVTSKVSGGLIQRLVVLVVLLLLGLVALALLAAVISETTTGRALRLVPRGQELIPPALVVVALVSAGLAVAWWSRRWRTRAVAGGFFAVTAGLIAVLFCCLGTAWSDLLARWSGGAGVEWWPQWWCLVVPAAFLVVSLLVDQTWLSMHPFYRRRLASAFSVRRVRPWGSTAPDTAEPYDFDKETTPLHSYADRWPSKAGPRVPHLIFAAAANLSGQDDAPPGRKATPFTFSHDWIGGPKVGYVSTEALHTATSGAVQADLTVQSAVAVSGAAFASAMGRQARAAQTLLALSNARLGTWLPNPRWLDGARSHWHDPRMPRLRRVTYLMREIIGRFSRDDRLLYVTDGGHYENLGLIELLRHRVATVVCVDAGGDHPPATSDIAEAITLAREELGVTIQLDNPWRLIPGRGAEDTPSPTLTLPKELAARLSETAMLTGSLTYPARNDQPEMLGKIIFVKLRLTADMPYDLLSYAQSHAEFPYDSTSDQWFDEGQFNAYHALGTYLGTQAVKALGPVPK